MAGTTTVKVCFAGAPPPDAGPPDAAGACAVDHECPAGQHCAAGAGRCTLECRAGADCASGACDERGRCAAAPGGDGSGCACYIPRRGPAAAGALSRALAALLPLLALLFLRRR